MLVPVYTSADLDRRPSSRVAFTVNRIDAPVDHSDLWELAGVMKGRLLPSQDRRVIDAALVGLAQAMQASPYVASVAGMMRSMVASDGMVTNIGALPFDDNYGDLELKEMWGPSILTGLRGERVLGALTLHGSLHFTLTTQVPLLGLMPLLLRQLASIE